MHTPLRSQAAAALQAARLGRPDTELPRREAQSAGSTHDKSVTIGRLSFSVDEATELAIHESAAQTRRTLESSPEIDVPA